LLLRKLLLLGVGGCGHVVCQFCASRGVGDAGDLSDMGDVGDVGDVLVGS
jgi:hypothetical protein